MPITKNTMTLGPRLLLIVMTGIGLLLTGWLLTWLPPGITPLGTLVPFDFLNNWAAPHIAAHSPNMLYEGTTYQAALENLLPNSIIDPGLRWSYPPHALLFTWPFAQTALTSDLLLWLGTGFACFASIAWLLFRHLQLPAVPFVCLLLSPVMLIELYTRQNGFFLGAGAIAVLLLLDAKRPLLGGILLGMLTVKPHLFLLWPFFLLATREWRAIAAACVTTTILVVLSSLAYGIGIWRDYFLLSPGAQWELIPAISGHSHLIYSLMMPSLPTALRLLDLPITCAIALQCLLSVFVVITSYRAFRQPLSLAQKMLLLASGGMLVTPYFFNYDMTFFTAALIVALPRSWFTRGGFTLALLAPALVYVLNYEHLPLTPLLILWVYYEALRRTPRFIVLHTG